MRGVSGRGFVLRDGREMLNRLHSLILLALLAASGTPGVALQSAPSASPQPTPEAPAPSSVVPPPPSPGEPAPPPAPPAAPTATPPVPGAREELAKVLVAESILDEQQDGREPNMLLVFGEADLRPDDGPNPRPPSPPFTG